MGTELVPKTEEAVPAETPSSVEKQIIRQIEYYFGNFNLSRDKFLREQLKTDDGWVPLEIMVKFNRLKKLSEDFTVITEALKKSTKQLMEVSDDCQKIRRRVAAPIPDDYNKRQEELEKRTLYVKGFKKTNTLDELLEYFKEHNVEHIYMKRHMQQNDRPFKGSLFVTFETEDDAKKFIETKGIKYNRTELLKEWKSDYLKRKDEYFQNVKAEKEKKILKKAGMLKENDGNDEKIPEIEIVPDCLLRLTNLDENTTREHIKEAFEPHGTVVYVDYSKGNPSAVIRFDTGIASSVLEKLTEEEAEKKIEIGSCKAVVTLVEGEEEKEYWKNIAISRAHSRNKFFRGNKNSHKGNKGRFKKWGKHPKKNEEDESSENRRRKINAEGSEDEQPRKKIKAEEKDEKTPEKMEVSSAAPEVKETTKADS